MIEKSFVRTNGISQVLGVIFGGLFVLGALAGAVYLLANDKPTAGYVTMVGALVPVAIGFIRVRAKQQAEKDAKTYGREGSGRSVVGARRTRK